MKQKTCRHGRKTEHLYTGSDADIQADGPILFHCPGPLDLKVEYDPQEPTKPWVETESKNATGTVEYEQRTI